MSTVPVATRRTHGRDKMSEAVADLAPGDTVRLKSGGPEMTVVCLVPGHNVNWQYPDYDTPEYAVRVNYFTKDEAVKECYFRAEVLERVR